MSIHYYLKHEHLDQITNVLHNSEKWSVRCRAWAIKQLHEGKSVAHIASCLEVTPSTIRNWWLNFVSSGVEGIGHLLYPDNHTSIQSEIFLALQQQPDFFGYKAIEWDTYLLRNHITNVTSIDVSNSLLDNYLVGNWYYEANLTSRYSQIKDLFFSNEISGFIYWLTHPVFCKGRKMLWRPSRFAHSFNKASTYELKDPVSYQVLLTGVTGKGKSTTINTFAQKNAAKIGDFERTTLNIQRFTIHPNEIGIPVEFIDSPGLCDALAEEKLDDHYLDLIRQNVNRFNRLIFVARLDDTRIRAEDMRSIKLITTLLGSHVWNRSIIMFTHADKVDLFRLRTQLRHRAQLFRREIRRYAGHRATVNTRVVALDNTTGTFLYPSNWIQQKRLFFYQG